MIPLCKHVLKMSMISTLCEIVLVSTYTSQNFQGIEKNDNVLRVKLVSKDNANLQGVPS